MEAYSEEEASKVADDAYKKVLEVLHNISKDKLVIVVTHNYEQIENMLETVFRNGMLVKERNLSEVRNILHGGKF